MYTDDIVCNYHTFPIININNIKMSKFVCTTANNPFININDDLINAVKANAIYNMLMPLQKL